MKLSPDELARFQACQRAMSNVFPSPPRWSALWPDEVAQVEQLLDERGARQTCALCDRAAWSSHLWGGHPAGLLLARTCANCASIIFFDAARLFPTDPIRARAEAWADTLAPMWARQELSREAGIASLIYAPAWVFSSAAEFLRYDRWCWHQVAPDDPYYLD